MRDDRAEKQAAIRDLESDIRRCKHDQANRKAMMQGLDPNSAAAKEHIRVFAQLEQQIAQAQQKIRQLS